MIASRSIDRAAVILSASEGSTPTLQILSVTFPRPAVLLSLSPMFALMLILALLIAFVATDTASDR
jgi:hypothetical protein